jgi:hypothetical protein
MQTIYALAATLCVGLASQAVAGTNHSWHERNSPSCAVPVAACTACEQAIGACGCMTCGSGISGCPSMCMPACSVCSDGMNGWDCCYTEAIDVDSLTNEAQSRDLYDRHMARIIVELPEDGTVYLLDQMMMTLGDERTYTVPIEDQTKLYGYEIKLEFVRGGKKYFKKTSISDFRAGSIVGLLVAAPPVPDGEPAEIGVDVAVLAAGGVGNPPEPAPEPSPAPEPVPEDGPDAAAAYDN